MQQLYTLGCTSLAVSAYSVFQRVLNAFSCTLGGSGHNPALRGFSGSLRPSMAEEIAALIVEKAESICVCVFLVHFFSTDQTRPGQCMSWALDAPQQSSAPNSSQAGSRQ